MTSGNAWEKRVWHVVVNYFGHRGAGMEYSLEMTEGLLDAGARVSAILCSDVENLDRWRSLGIERLVTVKTGDHYKGALLPALRFLTGGARRIVEQFDAGDVDLFYVPMTNPLSVELERRFRRRGVRTLFTLHDVVPHRDRLPMWLRPNSLAARHMARKSNRVALLTERFRAQAAELLGRSEDDFIITPHGVFRHLESQPLPVPEPLARVNFLFLGRIVRYKGLELLAEAYREVLAAYGPSGVSLRVVGSGDLGECARTFAEMQNVHVDNRFVPSDEIPCQLRMPGTVVVLPYTSSSQSGVIPQAMHEGVPLITTRLPGLLEQTLDGKLALICEPDAGSVAAAMRRAVEEPQILRAKADMARSHMETLRWDRIAVAMVLDALK